MGIWNLLGEDNNKPGICNRKNEAESWDVLLEEQNSIGAACGMSSSLLWAQADGAFVCGQGLKAKFQEQALSLHFFQRRLTQDFRLNYHQPGSESVFTAEFNQAEIEPSGTCWFWLNSALQIFSKPKTQSRAWVSKKPSENWGKQSLFGLLQRESHWFFFSAESFHWWANPLFCPTKDQDCRGSSWKWEVRTAPTIS